MTASPYFCSLTSRLAEEACFGTGVTADIWLLVECPEAWERDAVKGSSLPSEVKAHLNSLTKASKRIRVLLIKRDPRTDPPYHIFVAFTKEKEQRIASLLVNDHRELLTLSSDGLLNDKIEIEYEEFRSPLFLVCTHGKHDKCCAKYGFATYKLMHDADPGSVWQTSHIGGDRFASNVISFPTGVYYGHVDDAAALFIIAAEQRGDIFLENYRGRTCYGRYSQVGEYFIRRESGIRASDALLRRSAKADREKALWTVQFSSADMRRRYIVTFEVRRSDRKAFLTCHASEERSPVEYHLIEYRELEEKASLDD